MRETVAKVRAHEERLTAQFLEGVSRIKGIKIFGPQEAARQAAVVSLRLGDFAPLELSHRLFERGGLMTRSGLHCAPGAHQTLGTYPLGTTRFSFGYFNTPSDIEMAVYVLNAIAKNPTVAIR